MSDASGKCDDCGRFMNHEAIGASFADIYDFAVMECAYQHFRCPRCTGIRGPARSNAHEKQAHLVATLEAGRDYQPADFKPMVDRAIACARLLAWHADLTAVAVVLREDANAYCEVLRALGIEDSSDTAVETIAAKDAELATLRADLSTEQRRYEDMRQLANRITTALKKLSFMAQTTGGTADRAALQEAIQEAGHVMSMVGASEAVDAASELITLRAQLSAERELRLMQLAACSTTAIQNTASSVADRIGADNPYYTVAYGDVCTAVDREMALREQLAQRDLITEAMWSGLARDLFLAWDMGCKTPAQIFDHLDRCLRTIPLWLREEPEMQNLDHTVSKGTRAVIVYKAMREARQEV